VPGGRCLIPSDGVVVPGLCSSRHGADRAGFAGDGLLADLPIPDGQPRLALTQAGGIITTMRGLPDPKSPDTLLWNGKRLRLTQPFLIGRAADSDLMLDDAEASRRHAMLFYHEADWWLSDMGSRNGVRVNGVRLHHTRRLRSGDELRIGAQKLTFQSAETAAQRSTRMLGATTKVAADGQGKSTPGAVVCELIVAAANGEILEGDKAARWFFGKTLERPPGAAHSFLPQAVRVWLQRLSADDQAGSAALELQEVDRRVVVTLCRCNAGRYFLLVREDSEQVATQRLQSLGLTAREAEVMHWVCEGKTNPEIAAILSVTTHTVNRHMEHIFTKLGVDNRQRAILTVLERLAV
ncbi:MAG: FHA domain-containing protein, partial [Prosthecobacter sp.]